jgi:hypothetical protein
MPQFAFPLWPVGFRRLIVAALFCALPFLVRAQTLEPGDRAGIKSVIESQMAAFQKDDAARAFSFANPTIQRMFGSPERFMSMVREGYAPVYRPSNVVFGSLSWVEGDWIQAVSLVGPDGQPALALYTMEKQADGAWRIAGCALTKSPDAGA